MLIIGWKKYKEYWNYFTNKEMSFRIGVYTYLHSIWTCHETKICNNVKE